MKDWENQFREWAKPPGKTEEDRCKNAESSIKSALAKSEKLNNRKTKVFTHGSYKNNTNIRKDSDVDIGIICLDTFFYDLPEGYSKESFRISPATYHYSQFKNEVEEALKSYFGPGAVTRGNKALDVHETSYHVDADVAPFFEHRRYSKDGRHVAGVELVPDNGGRVINWPDQHYDNGVDKNKKTSQRFKAMVRVCKALKNEMEEAGYSTAKPIPGFLIECLVWNVPNDHFGHNLYMDDVVPCLTFLINNTKRDDLCSEWGEVSELKYLFRASQKWTRQQANDFLIEARGYINQ